MLKLVNPFYYPTAVLIGGIALVGGVRFLGLPNLIILPTAAAVATSSAMFLRSREPDAEKIALLQLEKELLQIKILANSLVDKAEVLRQEAARTLTLGDFQLELLIAVQSACDRITKLPHKINQLSQKISTKDSLLSSDELELQLQEVQAKIPTNSGIAKQQLELLATSLERNIQLAKTGKNTRQAQIVILHTLVQNSAGVLQELQNKLRTSNLNNFEIIQKMQELSQELYQLQENVDILIE